MNWAVVDGHSVSEETLPPPDSVPNVEPPVVLPYAEPPPVIMPDDDVLPMNGPDAERPVGDMEMGGNLLDLTSDGAVRLTSFSTPVPAHPSQNIARLPPVSHSIPGRGIEFGDHLLGPRGPAAEIPGHMMHVP